MLFLLSLIQLPLEKSNNRNLILNRQLTPHIVGQHNSTAQLLAQLPTKIFTLGLVLISPQIQDRRLIREGVLHCELEGAVD